MPVYTYSFARTSVSRTLTALCLTPARAQVPGLIHAECMANMKMGAPIFSPSRMQLTRLAMFAAWDSDGAMDDFLANTKLGQSFANGWTVRMRFLRRWGRVKEFDGLPENMGESDPEAPVVAVTLARMRLPEVPRFIRWGKPVEELIRDHPGALLASAAMRLPRTVSTFSIWSSQEEMEDMVHGHSQVERPERHAVAMKERERKDFHFEFTTLRFRPTQEHGSWEGRSNIIPFRSW